MEIKHAYLIFNKNSGKNRAECLAQKIGHELNKRGVTCEFCASSTRKEDDLIAKQIKDSEGNIAIVLGGDGTLGAMCRSVIENERNITLAVFPCGTANDFATANKVPRSLRRFVDFLFNKEPRYVDVMKVGENDYAINALGSGNFSNGVTKYNKKMKKVLGKFGYYLTCIKEFFRMKSADLTFKLDGDREIHAETLLYYFANSRRAGGFNNFVPTAQIDDGLWDLVIVKKCSRWACIKVLLDVSAGRAHKNKHIITTRASSAIVTGGEAKEKFFACDIDGNAGPRGTLIAQVLPKRIKIII